MASEPRKRKRRSNRPPGLDEVSPLPVEVTYYRSLRPFWDRNLKWKVQLPPLQVSSELRTRSRQDADGEEPESDRNGK